MAQKSSKKTPDFERTLAELEETVRRLEAGDLPLEDSLGAFEKGVALVRTLHARLDAVQMRIDELVQSPQAAASGSAALTPLDAGIDEDEVEVVEIDEDEVEAADIGEDEVEAVQKDDDE